jgi:putative ABC transport system permease protein
MNNIGFALRQLWKAPGFTAVAVLTLAVGIGACTAIFSLVDTVLLRPLPYPESDRVMVLQQRFKGTQDIPFSWPNYEDVARDNHSFDALALAQRGDYTLSGSGPAEKIRGAVVSSDFFRVLGVNTQLGRPFTQEEDRIGGGKVAVIRASLWERKFGGTRDVLGKTATFDGEAYTIVGVLPNDVITPSQVEFWLPLAPFSSTPSWQGRGNQPGLFAYGRLKPGVTLEQARADVRAIGERLQQQYPAECAETLPVVAPLLEKMIANYRAALWMLMGAVGLLLAIACANIGSLALARTIGRAQEFAIRAALGSTRGRLLRQVLVENILLFAIGGTLGVLLAYWSLDSIKAFVPAGARFQNLSVNFNVLLFSAGATLGTGLLFGLLPALRAARTDLREVLQGAGRGSAGSSSQWTRQIMVASEVALTVLLVAGAGLCMRSLVKMQNFQFGFDSRNLLVFTVSVPDTGGAYEKPEKRVALFDAVKERIALLPGVRSVGLNYSLPLRTQWSTYFDVAGREPYAPGHEPGMEMGVIDPGYFSTLGLSIIHGRNFNSSDKPDSGPKIIVDERMANAIWPGQDPIGKILYRGRAANRTPEEQRGTEVIGVVPTLALYGFDETQSNNYQGYVAQSQEAFNEMNFVVRSEVAPLSLEKSVRDAVAAVDPNIPVYAVTTMEKMIATNHVTQTLSSSLIVFFAVVALLLACLGLHGMVAHTMAARRREFGIRLALGASSRQVISLILRQGAVPLLIGLCLGLAGTFALGRVIAGLLYQISPNDPLTLLVTTCLMLGVGLLTLWRPALRVTKINPIIALRDE